MSVANGVLSDLEEQSDKQWRDYQKSLDDYNRTTLEINWEKLSLEFMILTALCGIALLVRPHRAPAQGAVVRKSEPPLGERAKSARHVQQASETGTPETVSGATTSEETHVGTSEVKSQESTEANGRRTALWAQSVIFFGGAILTFLIAGYALNLSYDATRLVTRALLQIALGTIAFNYALGDRWRCWLTLKRACLAALLVYGVALIWIFTTIHNRGSIPRWFAEWMDVHGVLEFCQIGIARGNRPETDFPQYNLLSLLS